MKQFPLGLLPLGESNTAASSIFGFNKVPEVKHLAEATMAIVRNVKRPLDVMEVLPLQVKLIAISQKETLTHFAKIFVCEL